MTKQTNLTIPPPPPVDAVTLDRIAREIGANVADKIDQHYRDILTERGLFNVKAWAQSEVLRWFGPPAPMAPDMDRRLRASAAHRRQMKQYRNLHGTIEPIADIEPIIAAMDKIDEQARAEYRAGGPVIEGEKQ